MATTVRTGAKWRHHERSGRAGTVALNVGALLLVGAAAVLWRNSGGIAVLGFACGLPLLALLALVVYVMGPRSGWAGIWTIRVFRDADEVARRVAAALADAGRPAHRAPDRTPSRWLRIMGPPKGAPFELPDGTLVWFLLRARSDATRPPETQIVLEPPRRLDPVELEFLKSTVLASMLPGYDARTE